MLTRFSCANQPVLCISRLLLFLLLIGFFLTWPCFPANSTIYKWRDARGHLHFSDSPPQNVGAEPISGEPSAPAQGKQLPVYKGRFEFSSPDSRNDRLKNPEARGLNQPDKDHSRDSVKNVDQQNSGIFWRIDSGSSEPSYLLGTMHSDDPRILATAGRVEKELLSCRLFVMETIMDTQAVMEIGSSLLLTDGSDLKVLLGKQWYNRAVEAAATRGIPEPFLRRMKPWVVMSILGSPAVQSGQFLDLVLFDKAVSAGKAVKGLETTAEQLQVFEGLTVEDQVSLLKMTIEQLDRMPVMLELLTDAYLSGDLDGIRYIAENFSNTGETGLGQRFMQRLNQQRNQRMFERLKSLLGQGNVFVAVGALHLAGPSGLVNRLRQAGYRLTAIR